MEMDFNCPKERLVGIVYSLTFIFGTTAIICMFTCSCWCKFCGTRFEGGDIEEGPWSYQECKDYCCSCCTRSCYKFVMSWNIPFFWLFILVIDGRYFECLVNSIRTSKGTMTVDEVWRDFPRQTIQVASLGLILIVGLIYLCKCGTRSEYLETKHKDNIRRHIQKALDEYKEEKIEDFVKQQVYEQLKSWNPELLNAEEESVEISINLRKEVVGKLNRPEGPPQTPGAADIARGPPQTPGATDIAGGPPQTPGAADIAGAPPQTPGAADIAGGPSQTPGAADIAGGPPQTPGAADIPLDQIQVETST